MEMNHKGFDLCLHYSDDLKVFTHKDLILIEGDMKTQKGGFIACKKPEGEHSVHNLAEVFENGSVYIYMELDENNHLQEVPGRYSKNEYRPRIREIFDAAAP